MHLKCLTKCLNEFYIKNFIVYVDMSRNPCRCRLGKDIMTISAQQEMMPTNPKPKRGRGLRNPDGAETSQPDMSQVVDPTPNQYHATQGQYYIFLFKLACRGEAERGLNNSTST